VVRGRDAGGLAEEEEAFGWAAAQERALEEGGAPAEGLATAEVYVSCCHRSPLGLLSVCSLVALCENPSSLFSEVFFLAGERRRATQRTRQLWRRSVLEAGSTCTTSMWCLAPATACRCSTSVATCLVRGIWKPYSDAKAANRND
jgi:hypothetical protein